MLLPCESGRKLLERSPISMSVLFVILHFFFYFVQVTDEYKCRKRSVHVNTRPLSAANVPVWMDVCHA